jgi:hypothetical protein
MPSGASDVSVLYSLLRRSKAVARLERDILAAGDGGEMKCGLDAIGEMRER